MNKESVMDSPAKLPENKIFLAIPILLGIVLYLNMYVASFFDGQEYFSLQSLILQIIKIYLYWYISSKIISIGNRVTAINFLISILTITVVSVVIAASYKHYLIVTDPQDDSLSWVHFANYGTHGIIVAFTVTLLAMLVMIMKKQQQVLVENTLLEKATVKAQLHALQTQVNPHFLFNNLNTLQSMIDTENIEAQNYLKNLSDLFRQILNHRDDPLVTLKEEIEFSQLFIHLLKGRFNTSLKVEMSLQNTDEFHLPPFTLQMLLENVIKHNRIDETHPIHCRIMQSKESITVQNNQNKKTNSNASTGVGLENLKRRYALLSDQDISIETMGKEGSERFKVTVPLLRINKYD